MTPPAFPAPSDLDAQLAALRHAFADARPPSGTDDAIAAAIASAQRKASTTRPQRAVGVRWLAWPLALAASIAVLSFIGRSVPPAAVIAEPAIVRVSEVDTFMPVVSLADIQGAVETLVVPARLPRTTLAALGLPIDPARAADAVDTELLVRPDGAVLAVRVVF